MYPIVWVLGEGTQKITVDTEIILFAIVSLLVLGGVDFRLIFWQRECLGDGYCLLISRFRRAMFLLQDGGLMDLEMSKGPLRKGEDCWMTIK